MTDRRRLWSLGDADEIARACQAQGARMVEPETLRIAAPLSDLCASPGGPRDRQLRRGQGFAIRAVTEGGWAFGEALASGYSGWVDCADLYPHPAEPPTHRIAVALSYAKTTAGLKAPGLVTPLSLGSELRVLSQADGWARIAWTGGSVRTDLFVPSTHLAPLSEIEPDPVAVAERLIGTPYLWGGDSAFGIDCSGLVQIACLGCGLPCPGDSDQQAAALGTLLPRGTAPERGDLLFWKGHVGWVVDAGTLLHANAHHMAVATESLAEAIARIEAQGDGPITAHKRL